jgi:hypothetical protein
LNNISSLVKIFSRKAHSVLLCMHYLLWH